MWNNNFHQFFTYKSVFMHRARWYGKHVIDWTEIRDREDTVGTKSVVVFIVFYRKAMRVTTKKRHAEVCA